MVQFAILFILLVYVIKELKQHLNTYYSKFAICEFRIIGILVYEIT
jgi:hypothetical protein